MPVSLSVKPAGAKRKARGAAYREPPIHSVAAMLAAGMSISGAVWNLLYVRETLRAIAGRGPAPIAPGLLDFFSIMAFPLAVAAAAWAVFGLCKENGWARLAAVAMAGVAVVLQLIPILGGPTSHFFV